MIKKFWTTKKIAFVAVLISTSVAFVLVFTSFVPIAIFPAVRLSIGGLPIKLIGFIFGPFIGAWTGLISYLLSFCLRPVIFHYAYMIAWIFTGFIPGCINWIFKHLWNRHNNVFFNSLSKKISNSNFYLTICILLLCMMILTLTILFLTPDSFFTRKDPFHYRFSFIILSCFGFTSMLVYIIIGRFFIKPKLFNIILIIVSFSAILEIISLPLMAWGDVNSLFYKNSNNFLLLLSAHFLLSSIRIWTNLFIIMIAYKIVFPLILNKMDNTW